LKCCPTLISDCMAAILSSEVQLRADMVDELRAGDSKIKNPDALRESP